jgi:hypothetical protein
MRRACVLLGVAAAVFAAASSTVRADRPAPQAPPQTGVAAPRQSAPASVLPADVPQKDLVQRYCVTCHSERTKAGGLVLQNLDPADAGAHAELWEKAVRKLRGGMMPPQGMPRPDAATLDTFTAALEQTLDRQNLKDPNPGHQAVHRLNRTEYGNAVRDLLDLKVDVAELLPPDDESNGFDNIAGVLRISPSLLEQYLSAARRISSLAVGLDSEVITQAYRIPPDDSQEDHVEGLPLGTRGGLLFTHNFPQDAEYDFSVVLLRNIVGYMKGLEYAHQLEISVDGERVFIAQVGGEADNRASDTAMSATADKIDQRLKARARVKAGPRAVAVTFLRRNSSESEEPLQPHERDHDLQNMNGIPVIDHISITGPRNVTGPGDTPSRRRVFACRPLRTADEIGCAKKILATMARRAYRRPITDADMEPLLTMYEAGRKKGSFDAGIEQGIRLVLANPKFLFRTEADATALQANGLKRISDIELASRLSFFLWSSIPDDELIDVAAAGRLGQPAVLERQVKRMLKDAKSQALVDNFASQWLMLRNLKSHFPTPPDYPNFNNELRQAFRTETEMFVGSIMREDRPVLDMLDANYTFVNERLAKHYRIPNVYGSHFRRVTIPNDERRGLLGQGSILSVTSYPNRTSPVLRGKWILENLLGTPPPAPPPNVPALKENDEGSEAPQSVRVRLESHRKDPACASCHRVMDPLGFALENFDGIGEWRTKEPGGGIDAAGQLADGSKVDGPVSLRKALLRHPEQFVGTLTEKMLTYALGRGVEYYDMPLVRAITREAAVQKYRFSSVVFGIVKSTPFQMKKAQGADSPRQTASR